MSVSTKVGIMLKKSLDEMIEETMPKAGQVIKRRPWVG